MSCLPSGDVFQSIEMDAVRCGIPQLELFGVDLADVRKRLSSKHGNVFEANAWWHGLVEEARRRPDQWKYAALWVSVPRLRSMMWEIYHITGLDLDECRSELISGALEALFSIDLSVEDVGKSFMTHAARPAWDLGRSHPRASVELGWDGDEMLLLPDGMPLSSKKIERILSARKIFLTPSQLAGERFGAIAAKLGRLEELCSPGRASRGASSPVAPTDFIKLFGLPQFITLKKAVLVYGISLKTAYIWIGKRATFRRLSTWKSLQRSHG